MPYKLEDLNLSASVPVRTIESDITQPAVKQEPSAPAPKKKAPKLPKPNKPNKPEGNLLVLAREWFLILLLALAGILAIAGVIKIIQFLFSI